MDLEKINKIVCIGTSFTEGDGLNPENDTHHAVKWYLENKGIKINSMYDYCWPTLLQRLSNIEVENLGKSGSSIEYLMRNVEEILEQRDCKDTLFILEYSSWGRSELWSTRLKQWIVANWGPTDGEDPSTKGYSVMMTTGYNFGHQLDSKYFDIYISFLNNFFNEKEYLLQRDRNFLNLLYKLEKENIKYELLMLENPFLHSLPEHRLFKPKQLIDINLWGYISNNGLAITHETEGAVKNSHPSITGHEHLAQVIYNKLKEKNYIG